VAHFIQEERLVALAPDDESLGVALGVGQVWIIG